MKVQSLQCFERTIKNELTWFLSVQLAVVHFLSIFFILLFSRLAPEARSRRRLQFAPAPLEGKSFFLHLQSTTKARNLEKKLKELGGVSAYLSFNFS